MLPPYDTLLSGGTLIDGSGRSAYEADVAIKGDRVVAIGKLRGARATEEIDIQGKCLTPGFIDTHTHDDQACMAAATMEPKISQGVTTVVVGNCGVSLAPLDHPPVIPEPINLLGQPEDFRFGDFRSYFDAVDEARPSTNVIALVGHSSLRVATMRDLERPATPAELDAMLGLLDDAMRAGASGLSTGVFYPLGRAADSGEVVPLVSKAGEHGGIYATHMRQELDRHPHPRLWGTFPRVIRRYAMEQGLFPLEEAIRKMTGLPAHRFGLHDRGAVAVGNYADLVVFDPLTIADRATYVSRQAD